MQIMDWLRQRVMGLVVLDDLSAPEQYEIAERCFDLVENEDSRGRVVCKAYLRGVCDTLAGRVQ